MRARQKGLCTNNPGRHSCSAVEGVFYSSNGRKQADQALLALDGDDGEPSQLSPLNQLSLLDMLGILGVLGKLGMVFSLRPAGIVRKRAKLLPLHG